MRLELGKVVELQLQESAGEDRLRIWSNRAEAKELERSGGAGAGAGAGEEKPERRSWIIGA
jgi:hypothetical protein